MKNYFETDLEGIKENLKTFLKTQDEIKDYNFDGSGINFHLNLMAYIVQYMNLYNNLNSSELILPSAQIANNIYKHANTLNYTPKRKSAAYIEVNLQRTDIVNIVIPKYSVWALGNLFLTNIEDIIINDSFVKTVRLYEGSVEYEYFYSNGSMNQEYQLVEREKIDNDNLFIYVDDSDGSGGYVVSNDRWVCANFEDFNIGDKAYYIQYFEQLKIQFDDGRLFDIPTIDQRIRVIYLKTSGADVNGSFGSISLSSNILNKNYLSIVPNGSLKNGTNEESINSIKRHAPLFYTTQNRAITESDYNILLSKYSKYDTFHSGVVWGGEKEYINFSNLILENTINKDLGHIYISALISDYSYLDEFEINDLFNYLNKYKIITMFLKFMHPTFINMNLNVNIKYESVLDLNLDSIESRINTYLKSNDGYKKSFYLSDVIGYIDGIKDVIYCTVDFTNSVTVYNEVHKVIRLNNVIKPNSISGVISGLNLIDDGNGNILYDGSNIGLVNYQTGFITLDYNFAGISTYEFDFEFDTKDALFFDKESFLRFNNINFNTL